MQMIDVRMNRYYVMEFNDFEYDADIFFFGATGKEKKSSANTGEVFNIDMPQRDIIQIKRNI